MGESQATLFQPNFNRSVHVEARADRVTADAGALLIRELVERSGLRQQLEKALVDTRAPERTTHPFMELLLTWLLQDVQGYPDQLDVSLLRDDPLFRLSVSSRRGERALLPARGREPDGLASQPTMSRTLTMLSTEDNRSGLGEVLAASGDVLRLRAKTERVLDLDSLPIEVHGEQPGSAYNGHFRMRCFHPLVLRSAEGFFLAARLREGTAHTATGALAFALPVLREEAHKAHRLWLRIDAGFPETEFLRTLEQEGILYVARLRRNQALERLAELYLEQAAEDWPARGEVRLHELRYRAGKWQQERRVVLVILERCSDQGELFIDHFFLLTNADAADESAEDLLARYRARGSAEKDFGEWQNTLAVRLSSVPRPKRHYRDVPIAMPVVRHDSFAANEARLLLSLLAANVMHAATVLLARRSKERWSRARFRALVLKTSARVIRGSRTVLIVIDAARAQLWKQLWRELARHYPVRGSPARRALPGRA